MRSAVAEKVPMVVEEHGRREEEEKAVSLSFSRSLFLFLTEYACGVAIPRARTKYLTLTIGETHARAPLPGLLAGSKTSAPPVICIPLTSHRGVSLSLSLPLPHLSLSLSFCNSVPLASVCPLVRSGGSP